VTQRKCLEFWQQYSVWTGKWLKAQITT